MGIGGTNAHIVLKKRRNLNFSHKPGSSAHFLSAKSQASLEENRSRLTDYFKKENPASWPISLHAKGRDSLNTGEC
ncbi:hypothetical protein CS542_07155 [Pedobacter sp. IW39]|nr:hypothetical protein CS542_07155 [Pedobacter sp. IW39]